MGKNVVVVGSVGLGNLVMVGNVSDKMNNTVVFLLICRVSKGKL